MANGTLVLPCGALALWDSRLQGAMRPFWLVCALAVAAMRAAGCLALRPLGASGLIVSSWLRLALALSGASDADAVTFV